MGVFDSFKKFLSFGDGAPEESKTSTPSGIPTAPMKFDVGAGLTPGQSKTADTTIKKQVSYAEKEKASKQLSKVKKVESVVQAVGNVPIPLPTGRSIFESLPGAKLVTTAMKLPTESPVTSIKVKDVPRETIQATGGSLFRTLARGALEFSPETAKARDEGKTTPRLVPSTKEAKFLIGEEEIRPISEGPIASKVSSPFVALAERMGASPSTAGKVGAIPALAFGAFVENPFIGSTAKAGKELGQEVIEKVAKSAKADEIFDIVKPFFKEFSDDEVKLVAKELETVTDPKVVNQVIGNKISSFEKAKEIFDSKDFSKVKPLEVQTRLTDLPQTKQRSLLRTILDSDTASPKLKEEVAKLDQTYETITNQDTLDRARALVATDYDEALKVVKEKPVSDEMTGATAQTLIKKAEAEGRYDDAIDIVRTIDERARDAGRYIQSLSLWSKLSPEGMLRFAQREIRQANEARESTGIITKTVKKIFGSSTNLDKQIVSEASDAVSKINLDSIEPVLNGEKINSLVDNLVLRSQKTAKNIDPFAKSVSDNAEQMSLFKNLDLNKLIKENENPQVLSKKIQKFLEPTKTEPKNREQEMIDTLFRLAKEFLPEREVVKKSVDKTEIFADALKNRNAYSKVWDNAEKLLTQKYKDQPEILLKLKGTFDHIIGRPFSQKDVAKAVSEQMKESGVTIKQLIRENLTTQKKTKSQLIQDIVGKTGYKEADVKILIDEIAKEFNTKTNEAKKKALELILNKSSKVTPNIKKTVIDKMIEFSNLGAFENQKYLPEILKSVKMGDIELDAGLAQTILTKMKQAQAMPEGPDKIKLVTEVMQDIANKVPPSFSEMFDAYRYQNILSGPRTQLRNLYGNAFQTFVTKPATMATEAFIDTIGAGITGKERTKYFSDVPLYLRETTNAIPDAVRAFAETWRGERLSGNLDMRTLRQKNLPKSLTVVSRLMEGTDQFLQTMIGAGEYAVQRRAGIPEEVAKEEARKVAQYFLLRKPTDAKNLTGQGKMLSKLDAASDAVIDLGNKFKSVRWFVPFVRTPINAAKQWVEYSPLGAANMLSGGVAKKQEAAAKALLGSTVFALGAQKAWDGETTWSAPTDPEQKKLFYASGKKPYSVRVGDKWVPMIYAGPFALALAIPAAMKYHSDENPNAMDMSAMEKTYRTLLGSVEFFSQQTFMQGLGTYVSLLSGDPDSSLPASMAYTSSQALPLIGMVRYVNNNFIDPTFRKSKGFLETLKKDLPVLSKDVPAIVGPEGTEQKRQLYNAFTPYDIGPHVEEYNRILKLRQEASAIRKQLKASDSEIDAQASQIIETFKDRTAEENIALLEDLEKENPEMVKSIADQLEKESESKDAEVRFYKGLEVKNGMRAMFILDRMKELEPGTETENFLIKLAEEGVLTEDILEQIAELKAQQ